MQSALDAVRVAQLLKELESTVEIASHPSARQRVDRLYQLAMEQVEQASNDQHQASSSVGNDRYETQRKETERELRALQSDSEWVVCEPLLACSESISSVLCPIPPVTNDDEESNFLSPVRSPPPLHRDNAIHTGIHSVRPPHIAIPSPIPEPPLPLQVSSTFGTSRSRTAPAWAPEDWTGSASGVASSDNDNDDSLSLLHGDDSMRTLNPPNMTRQSHSATSFPHGEDSMRTLYPPNLIRPSHSTSSDHGVVQPTEPPHRASTEEQLQKALFLSGLEVSNRDLGISTHEVEYEHKHRHSSQRLELATLSTLYHEDFELLLKSGQIRISYADTFQGRVPESTNGCTVIAPLLSIHHLLEIPAHLPDTGLTDVTIRQVIDLETPSILTQLRKELGLAPAAFLIPSDAHDFLIENGQLSQDQFVTVSGGNILDDGHLRSIVSSLSDSEKKYRKLAATLFFHEHVVAILRVQRGEGTCWYDVIDSLPTKRTMMRPNESIEDFHRRMGLELTEEEMDDRFLPMASRIRCLDEDALLTCLRWYACSKFDEENISYVDQYAWDENDCDFDPRVFQAFIWSEAPQ